MITLLSTELAGCSDDTITGFPFHFYWEEYGEAMEMKFDLRFFLIDAVIIFGLMMLIIGSYNLLNRYKKTA
jgi:hypothetical protein